MEQASAAFGRYLRRLREHRDLSLSRVCRLSETSPYGIDKATLSRFERGQQRPTLSVLVPLSRIYHVPAEILLERFELDMELERIGGPVTEGLFYGELHRRGREALIARSRKWEAYGYLRDAAARAEIDPHEPRHHSSDEQAAHARMNLATIARSLGKNRYALFEYHELESEAALPDSMVPVLLERISNCYRCLGDFDLAERYVERAIDEARCRGDRRALAYAYFARASNALDQHVYDDGIELLGRAFRSDRSARGEPGAVSPNPSFGAHTLIKLSDAYLLSRSLDKAGRAGLAAKRLSQRHRLSAGLAYSEFVLGRVDAACGREDRALERWRRAAAIAERVHNTRLNFTAECSIYKHSIRRGNRALASASRQRLERLAPWVPEHLPSLAEFHELSGNGRVNGTGAPRRPSPHAGEPGSV